VGEYVLLFYGLPILLTLLSVPILGLIVRRMGMMAFVAIDLLVLGSFAYLGGAYDFDCQGGNDVGCALGFALAPMAHNSYAMIAIGASLGVLYTIWRQEKKFSQNA